MNLVVKLDLMVVKQCCHSTAIILPRKASCKNVSDETHVRQEAIDDTDLAEIVRQFKQKWTTQLESQAIEDACGGRSYMAKQVVSPS